MGSNSKLLVSSSHPPAKTLGFPALEKPRSFHPGSRAPSRSSEGMSSAMAMAAVPVGFSTNDSRITGARSPCAGAQAGMLPRRPPLASSSKGIYSSGIPSSSNTLHVFYQHHKTRYCFPRAVNVTAGQSDDPQKLGIDGFIAVLKKLWDSFPQPVRNFPWTKAGISFCQLIFELTWAVAKCLSIPLLAISSLSEMSYCAHERKMKVIPIPLLAGFAVAGVLEDTAIDLSPDLKEERFPVHLLLISIFFLLLKLPGPHYPYWGRLIIPHFANGGLWRTAWSAFMWGRKPERSPTEALETLGLPVGNSSSEDEKQ